MNNLEHSLNYLKKMSTSQHLNLINICFPQAPQKQLVFSVASHNEEHVLGLNIDTKDTKNNTIQPISNVFIDIFKPQLSIGKKKNTTILNIEPLTAPTQIKTIISKKTKKITFIPQYKIQNKLCKITGFEVFMTLEPLSVEFTITGVYQQNKDSQKETHIEKIKTTNEFATQLKDAFFGK